MSQRPRKLRRASKACDFCNSRSIKCSKSTDDPLHRCKNCSDFDMPCTFNRPTRRRGTKTKPISAVDQLGDLGHSGSAAGGAELGVANTNHAAPTHLDRDLWSATAHNNENGVQSSWKAFAIASEPTIMNLVQAYFEIVYPIFPLFHRVSFINKLQSHEYLRNQGLFASTMAVCALTSARARDGALYSNRWDPSQLASPPSEVFQMAAKDSIPKDLATANGTDYMRACAILAIASIQNGQIRAMRQYAGMYHTLLDMDGLYDEKLWPKNLNVIEIEERRRLFWSIYTLDIYSSIVWGGIVRYREAHSMVKYPSEVDDEFIASSGYGVPSSNIGGQSVSVVSREPVSWLRGWNYTTDLYRILEYAVDAQGRRNAVNNGITPAWPLYEQTTMSESSVMEKVQHTYAALPSQLKETLPVTGDSQKDLFGFQSANIQATLQLLRMVLFSTEERSVDKRCDVAGELLSAFSKIPVEYLKAISAPLLHHLGGIGYILGSVMEGSLSETSYRRVRTLLLEMADLLQRLESGMHRAAGASERLKTQVGRIDEYMRTLRPSNTVLRAPRNHGDVSVSGRDSEGPRSSAYIDEHEGPGSAPLEFGELSPIQLPPELLVDWPWPFGYGQTDGILPLGFEP